MRKAGTSLNVKSSQRQSNIELLRIVAMLGVIVLHYNNPTIGGGFAYAKGLNLWILYFLESMFICAVNLFILISGYFMCKDSRRSFMKPLELLVQVIVFREATYFAGVILGKTTFSINEVLENLLPMNYFAILYIVLYFISPILNMIIEKAVEKNLLQKVMLVLLVVFLVYPTLVDLLQDMLGCTFAGLSSVGMYGSQYGYTIINL